MSVALVPTMGNLHAGHIALVETAKQYADKVAVSLFVNPLQFDRQDDFAHYPRTQQRDLEQLRSCGTALVFVPEEREIYSAETDIVTVSPGCLGDELCGQYRPGHFVGVLTITAKLFNLFMPNVAVFGEKDYQQLVLIKLMTKHLFINLQIISVATVRDGDGLALSSRNNRLSPEENKRAPLLHKTLKRVAEQLGIGNRHFAQLTESARQCLSHAGFQVDYVEIRTADTLTIPTEGCKEFVVLAAATLGFTRLIDNIRVTIV